MKTIALAIAWIWVAVPLGWGVYQSVQKSMPLFHGPTQPAATSNPSEKAWPASVADKAFPVEATGRQLGFAQKV